ncbi:MAG: hypothetical protein JWO95_1500 [Verrucomicrobiales bacterium]|nr:hypothetical protein [Verrucomicrobiales bacterium]
MAVMAVTISLIAAGYWLLAVAAKRGNPHAVGIVIVAMVLQICMVLIFAGVTAARTNTPFVPPVGGLFIPILVLIALASSRKVLLELKERQLWQQVFGAAKPSSTLCAIGGTLVVLGFVSMNAATSYLASKVTQQRTVEIQHANAFVQLLKSDEQEFLSAVKMVYRDRNDNNFETALTKFDALEQHLASLTKDTPVTERLGSVLAKYSSALRQWKNGLLLLKGPDPDPDRAQKLFTLGDRFRAEACQEYDQRYAPKKNEIAN